jgi:hypothetical protein
LLIESTRLARKIVIGSEVDHGGDARAIGDSHALEASLDRRLGGEIDADTFRSRRRRTSGDAIEADQRVAAGQLVDES